MLSHRVNGRLSLGSAIGIASIKPLGGSWSGGGFASVTSEWRLLPKSESWLLSARYTPYAGTLNIEGDYYDATIHGIFLGGKGAKSNLLGASTFKVGVDVGYLLIYSKPQGGYESTRSSKEGKVSVGTSTELVWKTMEKMQVGPFLAASFGNIQMIQGGALALFLF